MCGIAGIIYFDTEKEVDPSQIEKMCRRMVHRGPDDQGIYIEKNVGLGHRRLSIIDLSPNAKQPMLNEDETVVLVFNGEIYNFTDLREELIKKGHKFRSETDSEVVIHLYEDYGENCLQYLEGMFAFAIWDTKDHVLFIARDRLGKKPVYYSLSEERIVFSSEINALKKIPDVDLSIDFEALDLYLEYQFIPSPWTIYKGIKSLHPSQYLTLNSWKCEKKQYWDVDYCEKMDISFLDTINEAEARIEEAVKKRMISDVPMGALLSGGVDSSLVVYFMSKLSASPIKTFSVGFKEEEFNELPYAKKVSEICDTEHHQLYVTPKIQDDLPKIVLQYGQPFADKSIVPSYYVCQMARNYVTVVLNGDGGDELCLGYDKYKLRKSIKTYMKLPARFRKKLMVFADLFPNQSSLMKKAVRNLMPELRVLNFNSFWTEELKKKLFREELKEEIKDSHFKTQRVNEFIINMNHFAHEPEERLLWADIHNYLPHDLLVKMDIASMAHSLEARSPFLDHKLVEFFSKIPLESKINDNESKYLLKKIAEKYLPSDVLYRKKQGFSIPTSKWIKEDMSPMVKGYVLDNKQVGEWFDSSFISELVERHGLGLEEHGYRIWTLLILGIWLSEVQRI